MKEPNIGVILLAMMLLVGMLAIPATAVKTTDEVCIQDPQTDIQGFLPVNRITINNEIKNATPYYVMLIGNEKEKQNLFRFIDNSSTSEDEKIKMKEVLKGIWKKYPVRRTTTQDSEFGSMTYLSFNSGKKGIYLTDEENKWLEYIDKAMAEPYNREIITPKWAGFIHGDIIYEACIKERFPDPETAKDAADDPDSWSTPGIPSFVPQNIQTAINAVFHSWNHYYNPDLDWGGAPSNTRSYSEVASDKYDQGEISTAAQNLGWASHFLTDVGNPMHTGKEVDQYLAYLDGTDVHGIYESYVSSKWGTNSAGLKKVVHDNNGWYWLNPWDQATKELASYSHRDLDTLYTEVYNYRDNLDYAPDVYSITQNNILRTAKYTNGLVKWVIA